MISWVDRSGFCHFLSFIFVNYSLVGARVGRMGFEIKKAENFCVEDMIQFKSKIVQSY